MTSVMGCARAALLLLIAFFGCTRTPVVVAHYEADSDVGVAPSDARVDARDADEPSSDSRADARDADEVEESDGDTDRLPLDILGMAAGHEHTCAWRSDGRMWCWGSNEMGQLGVGTQERHLTPTLVLDIDNVAGASAQGATTCAWSDDGEAWCWGDNANSQVGDGSSERVRTSPSRVHGLSSIDGMSVGRAHSCAWGNGQGWCWGVDSGGALGNGEVLGSSPIPTELLLDNVDSISRRCALTTTSRPFCWGSNLWGQLGIGDSLVFSQTPTEVTTIDGVIGLSAGDDFVCAWLDTGTTMCWGSNNSGQLGPGVPTDPPLQYLPVANLLSTGIMGIGSGVRSACAWFHDGAPLWFGSTGLDADLSSLNDVRGMAVGGFHACAWDIEGGGYCWGRNGEGQVGDGTTSAANEPIEIRFEH